MDARPGGGRAREEFKELFRQAQVYERALLELWRQGAGIPLKDGKYPLLHNPLVDILDGYESSQYREPCRIMLAIPQP